ncbi:UNKNOWN [Stylonychia lemnae]|uniref:Uncharacterized protein n=1 Tax=Stylonychia lemnae TaxID=5949 RepID=A0A078A8L6_STYLE|nr:UNKNOWN [Stylonychia lemnae]|eukprot:CDW78569.1 UNKNOWN [Stylonychia lemnae]
MTNDLIQKPHSILQSKSARNIKTKTKRFSFKQKQIDLQKLDYNSASPVFSKNESTKESNEEQMLVNKTSRDQNIRQKLKRLGKFDHEDEFIATLCLVKLRRRINSNSFDELSFVSSPNFQNQPVQEIKYPLLQKTEKIQEIMESEQIQLEPQIQLPRINQFTLLQEALLQPAGKNDVNSQPVLIIPDKTLLGPFSHIMQQQYVNRFY